MDYTEMVEYPMRALYIAKAFYDHGRLDALLDELDDDISLSPDELGFIELASVECVFEDTRYYVQTDKRDESSRYWQNRRNTYVMRDPLLTRYDDLCRKLEMKLGITKVENQFARDLNSGIQRSMRQISSYSYDYRWLDSTQDHKGAKFVLFLFEEFVTYYDVAVALFDILDFCVEGIPKLEAALAEASKEKVLPLPVKSTPEKEAA